MPAKAREVFGDLSCKNDVGQNSLKQHQVSQQKLLPRTKTTGQRVSASMCFGLVLDYLPQVDTIHLQ